MKVAEIGEFGLIDYLARMIAAAESAYSRRRPAGTPQVIVGLGDDAAAWHSRAATHLITTDTLIEGVHFRRESTSWRDLGWKALAVNLSDIAAMGGVAWYALVSLSLPLDTEVEEMGQLYQGMLDLGREFEVRLLGGNVTQAPQVVITLTVVGRAKGRNSPLLLRSAARPGDQIAVTGHLGDSAAGCRLLAQGRKAKSEAEALLQERHRRPRPRLAEGILLARAGVKAAIDLSDGLLSDLEKLCQASGVAAQLWQARVPRSPQLRAVFPEESLRLALAGGEDYELLFTAPADLMAAVRPKLLTPATIIGEIEAGLPGKVTLLDERGNAVPWEEGGWDHFKASRLP